MGYSFKRFDSDLDRSDFECGNEALNRYIKELASPDEKRNISRVFVMINDDEPNKVIGYYAISTAQVDISEFSDNQSKQFPRYQPVPAIRIGRLALDSTLKGQGLGSELLGNALMTCFKVSEDVGSAVVIVDCKDEGAEKFYRKYGFLDLANSDDVKKKMYIPIKTIKKSLS